MPEVVKMKERINAPIVFETQAPEPEKFEREYTPASQGNGVILLPNRGVHSNNAIVWDQQAIHNAIMLSKNRGFNVGAVVAMRALPGSGMEWKAKAPYYWGIVTALNYYIPGNTPEGYAPITVRWLDKDKHNGITEEKLFPGLLYLIHAPLTEEALDSKLKTQC